jgi:hypothetical protein
MVTTRNIWTKSLASTAQAPPETATTVTIVPRMRSVVTMSAWKIEETKTPMALSPTPAPSRSRGTFTHV